MKQIKRKISLRDFKTFAEGPLYGEFVEPNMYIKVDLTQSGDDMGIFTDLGYDKDGDLCSDFVATLDITHITCHDPNGGLEPPSTGAINIDISGGEAPYTVFWGFDGSGDLNKVGLSYGVYSITITDANECQLYLEGEVEVFTNANPSVTVTLTYTYYHPTIGIVPAGTPIPIEQLPEPMVICEGEVATLTAEGGFNTYLWSTGANTQQITVDVDGAYSVAVTSFDGCEGESDVQTIDFVPIPTPIINTLHIPNGIVNGQAQGDGSYAYPYRVCYPQPGEPFPILAIDNSLLSSYSSYHWNSGSNTSDITITSNGCYNVGVVPLCNIDSVLVTDYICIEFIYGPCVLEYVEDL